MKTVFYIIVTGLGLLLSVPMMVIIIAWQQALHETDKMKRW